MADIVEDELHDFPCKLEITLEQPYCFVCDQPAPGVYFNLLDCLSEPSQTKISATLGKLVGKEFMFVIENTDIICRSCVNIFNTMDRLMLQLANLGNTILNYLEEKYSLIPGEIFQTAPPLHVVFKKDISKAQTDEPNKISKNTGEKEKTAAKELSCQIPECSYTTTFKALMVFHMRQHDKLNNPPSSEHTEEVVSNPPGETVVPSPSNNKLSKGGKRMKPVKEGNKKMKMTAKEPEEIVVAPSPPLLIQEEETSIHVDGMDPGGGFEFMPGQDDDHFSEDMLIKVESLVQGVGVQRELETGTFQVDMVDTDVIPNENELQVFLTDHDLLEVAGEPGVFCMLDSETGKIIQRLKKVDDGSFEPLEVLDDECQTVMHQLEDGSFALVSLPSVLENSSSGLTLI